MVEVGVFGIVSCSRLRVGGLCIKLTLIVVMGELLCIHHVQSAKDLGESGLDAEVDVDAGGRVLSGLCGDDDDTVGTLGTVDGG